jgi:hypothetical protein
MDGYPPYAQPLITEFSEKLASSVESGDVEQAVVLVNNATETRWFHTLAGAASATCFPSGRVKYWGPDREASSPLQGQTVLYFGQDVQAFADRFTQIGLVLVQYDPRRESKMKLADAVMRRAEEVGITGELEEQGTNPDADAA